MKKLGKLKLNQLSKDELDHRKLNALKGGCECTYGCGGSSCSNPCRCNDWLSGGINSANTYRSYEGNSSNGSGSSAY